MVSKGVFLLSCHGVVWVAAIALALWAGGVRAAVRYDTATPYSPPYNKYKYIPVNGYDDFESIDPSRSPVAQSEVEESSYPPISQYLLSTLKTVLEVVRNMNKQRSAARLPAVNATVIMPKRKVSRNDTIATGRELEESNNTALVKGRGFEDYYDEHYHDHHETTTTAKPMKQGRYTDPWAGYYDWIINEGSFKFWSVFQLFTAALLLYACLSAIYYAKFNPILPDYSLEYDDYFLERTVGRHARSLDLENMPSGHSWINPRTFQFILDAISNHYEQQS